ncbi:MULTISPECIES: peptidoglycan D,D-transpeptidase FtsI family protein [unclassified Coleofasciculus]|uniref:peptidoglycan D,D-transpeptidase FtsI family protein n=1 Tax=unclassified Coleofasciculus TaxID=2692782 RepID=UPI0018804D42|nr:MULTISPECIES: penicillin-binding protein 2 [unclassified Coleofasciculus]MBE9129650.1 penicillin-binding protein 2 [Coleofasciculus sp. LEGE 07081]MBE9152055.1 penicillin-binding protein 2 [Coleofasciculus sp. LEGE 07092]
MTKLSQLPRFRLLLIWGMLIAGGIGLLLNLYRLQVVQAPMLEEKAREQQMIYLRPFVPRRPIVDRNDNVLAVDRRVYTLYAHPKLFKSSKQQVAVTLAPILGKSQTELEKLFNQQASGIRLSYTLAEEVADQVARLNMDGLEMIQQYSRLYPQQDLAADVVGYVDVDHRGQAGIEYSQEDLLERAVRTLRLSRAGNGSLMPDHVPEGFLHFDELRLQLTLDSRLQRAARFALKEKIEQFNAKRGTVIVMDALDGSLLALVSEPTYNPNKYYNFDVGLFKNWALTDLYEPGSTFKPLNVAIALETGAIQPDSLFNDTGSIQIGKWSIANYDKIAHGTISLTQILKYSSNVGMVRMIQQMKPGVYYDWLERLGLGQKVETDLPFEAPGQIKSQREFTASPVEPATASFGQGFSLTPMQLAQMHATLANGGKLVTPHVIQGLFDSNGQLYWQPHLSAPRPIFSPGTTQSVLEMMEAVVSEGTGKVAQIPGYRVAGKTGTAQKASPAGGYFTNAKITSFVGILSVDSPRYVVLAVVDEPKGNAFGSTVAAPIVKSVMEALIAIERIPPSESTTASTER